MRRTSTASRPAAGGRTAGQVFRVASIALVLCSGHAWPQPVPDTVSHPLQMPGQADAYRSSRIIGTPVRDRDGRRIGNIQDLILSRGRNEVAYAVISFGGVLGVGKTFHPVPWSSLEPQAGGHYYVLAAERGALHGAPGFDPAHWPDIGQQAWREDVDRYWESVPVPASGGGSATEHVR